MIELFKEIKKMEAEHTPFVFRDEVLINHLVSVLWYGMVVHLILT